MSTIKVNNIDPPNVGEGVSIDGLQMPTAGALSNRNLIINGAMQCSQRGTAFASAASGGGRYTTDRWNVPFRTRAARSTDAPAGFAFSLLIDREQTGGTEPFTVSTGIEVQDITQTGSYTLSFYAKSADVTTLNINVQDRTGVGEGGTNNSSIVTNQAVTIDNTWTRYTHTFTISSVTFTGTSLRVSIGNTSAAQDDEAYITGVQLEVGSKATPFEHRSFGDELLKCQRYYQTTGKTVDNYPGVPTNNRGGYWGITYPNNANTYGNATFKTIMRENPSIVIYDENGLAGTATQYGSGHGIAASAAQINITGFSMCSKASGNWHNDARYTVLCGYTADAEL